MRSTRTVSVQEWALEVISRQPSLSSWADIISSCAGSAASSCVSSAANSPTKSGRRSPRKSPRKGTTAGGLAIEQLLDELATRESSVSFGTGPRGSDDDTPTFRARMQARSTPGGTSRLARSTSSNVQRLMQAHPEVATIQVGLPACLPACTPARLPARAAAWGASA